MPTHAQLRFIPRTADDQPPTEVAQVAVQTDGYPGAVVRELRDLVGLLTATRSHRGPSFAAAQYVFLGSLYTYQLYVDDHAEHAIDATQPGHVLDPRRIADLEQPQFLRGHAIVDPRSPIHDDDEDYLYVVEVPRFRETVNPFDEWQLKISEHRGFPTGDEQSAVAFDQAAWQFDGTLWDAIGEYYSQ